MGYAYSLQFGSVYYLLNFSSLGCFSSSVARFESFFSVNVETFCVCLADICLVFFMWNMSHPISIFKQSFVEFCKMKVQIWYPIARFTA